MRKILLTSMLVFPSFAFANNVSLINNPVIGDVKAIHESAELVSFSEKLTLNLEDETKVNDLLYQETDLVTGSGSRLHATLIDGSKLMVGENSEIKLNKFLLKEVNSVGELEVVKGAFRLISGQINKTPGGTLKIKTPLVSIGIRGTDFWGLQTEQNLTLALIDNGIIDVTTLSGEEVTLDQSMTFILVDQNGNISEIQKLPTEVLEEAAKTVSLPE